MKKPKLEKMVDYNIIIDEYKKMYPEYKHIFENTDEYNISKSIKHYEEMISDYKSTLKWLFTYKELDKSSENIIWWKNFMREQINELSITLRELILEKTYENQGMNHPFCYEYLNKK